MIPEERPPAVLVAVKLPDQDEASFTSSLAELERLVTTLGYQVVERITQARPNLAPGAVLGEGKLAELGALTGGPGTLESGAAKRTDKARQRREAEDNQPFVGVDEADDEAADSGSSIALIAVDHDISPSQARNLERATGVQVLDRTGVIIEIFHRHAKSREARLQVEIARLTYSAPRLRESPSGRERQRGRGAGEAALELDRRKIRDRIAELREELTAIARDADVRRVGRKRARTVALAGYTNAGKSSLMRALTGSQVLVQDKLFATLDTTVRALHPEVKPRILVSDTVGFIKKLPHDLVASFKSTLDEAAEASLLLHVVDASDPDWPSQHRVTEEVLEEIEAREVPRQLVMNKIDRLDPEQLTSLRAQHPDAWFLSAHRPDDITWLHGQIGAFFERDYEAAELLVPYTLQRLVSEMHELGSVDDTHYEDDGVRVQFRAQPQLIERMRQVLRDEARSSAS